LATQTRSSRGDYLIETHLWEQNYISKLLKEIKSKLRRFFQLHHIQDDEDDRKPKDLVHHQSDQNSTFENKIVGK
jgi:superfamily I DNA and RNA helicase